MGMQSSSQELCGFIAVTRKNQGVAESEDNFKEGYKCACREGQMMRV